MDKEITTDSIKFLLMDMVVRSLIIVRKNKHSKTVTYRHIARMRSTRSLVINSLVLVTSFGDACCRLLMGHDFSHTADTV